MFFKEEITPSSKKLSLDIYDGLSRKLFIKYINVSGISVQSGLLCCRDSVVHELPRGPSIALTCSARSKISTR